MSRTNIFAPIVKSEKQADGTIKVWGKATGPDLDIDQQICDPAWLAKAMPDWFQYGNIREQHSSIAAGVGTLLEQDGDNWNLEGHIVDAGTVRKFDAGVLKGYSVGIRSPKIVKDAAAPGVRIVGGQIVEVSLVDRPANPTCTVMLAKSVGGVLTKADPTVMPADDPTEPPEGTPADDAEDAQEEAVEVDLIAQLLATIDELLIGEVSELAEGEGTTGPVSILISLRDLVGWFVECDDYDDMTTRRNAIEAALAGTEDTMNLTTLATLTKAATGADATDIDRAAVSVLRKALGIDDLDTKIATALTKAAPAEDLVKVAERLAKVEQTAMSSGPTRVVPQRDPASYATETDRLGKAANYRHLAGMVIDRDQAAAYRTLADQLDPPKS